METIEKLFDNGKYLAFPMTKIDLALNLIKVIDDYTARKINNEELKTIIYHYVNNVPELLFNGPYDYNATIKAKLGVRRITVIEHALKGFQQKMF